MQYVRWADAERTESDCGHWRAQTSQHRSCEGGVESARDRAEAKADLNGSYGE